MPQLAKKLRTILIIIFITISLTIVIYEGLLRIYPNLIPGWYRSTFPFNGVELFYPGLTNRTPIDQVPLPLINSPYVGPPPSDLQAFGLVAPQDNPDPKKYPSIKINVDKMGFPNPSEVESPDIIFIGDSFVVGTGVVAPAGLQVNLSKILEMSVSNLGVAGIGPIRESWLLKHLALPKQPKAIIWFFFAGNDPTDALIVTNYRKNKITNYAQLVPDFNYPRLLTFDMFSKFWSKWNEPEKITLQSSTKKGFTLSDGDKKTSLWFYPPYLRLLTKTVDDWQNDAGWAIAKDVIAKAHSAIANSQFILVYIPSKSQVYLPYVEQDEQLVYDTASFGNDKPIKASPSELTKLAIKNRKSLEVLFEQFCVAQKITCLSATPYLEGLAQLGILGYLAADTHWNEIGQNILLEQLITILSD